jgi:nucleotide-binding universal stress UspA family protein
VIRPVRQNLSLQISPAENHSLLPRAISLVMPVTGACDARHFLSAARGIQKRQRQAWDVGRGKKYDRLGVKGLSMKGQAAMGAAVQPTRAAQTQDAIRRIALRKILFATDLSTAAEKALPYALEIARRYGAMLYVVHAIAPAGYPYAPVAAWPKLEEEEERFREHARQRLEHRLEGIPHEIDFRHGQVLPVLRDTIQDKQVGLLVIGTHGRTGMDKVVLGSVAESIFREAACPTLTVGPRASTDSHSAAELSRILYATDFSPASLAAAPYAISLSHEHRAQLILLNCLEEGGDAKSMIRTLRELVPFGADLRCQPICVAEQGPHGEKIPEVCEAMGVDLLVLGAEAEKNPLARQLHFHRSALYKIVTQATCPVLTVRA